MHLDLIDRILTQITSVQTQIPQQRRFILQMIKQSTVRIKKSRDFYLSVAHKGINIVITQNKLD